jgi:hypothetical protein
MTFSELFRTILTGDFDESCADVSDGGMSPTEKLFEYDNE